MIATARLCAICVKRAADRVDPELGASICAECDEGEIRCVNSDRRCETSEGIGWAFKDQLVAAMTRVIPERVRKLDEDVDCGIVPAIDPGYVRSWNADNLSPNEIAYRCRRGSRNRGGL